MRSGERAASVLVQVLLLVPFVAHGDEFLTAEFTGPVIAGQPATLHITLRSGFWEEPVCGGVDHEIGTRLQWGDGSSGEWKPRQTTQEADENEPRIEDGEFEMQHTYEQPGRYAVFVTFHWTDIPAVGCDATGGTLWDLVTVDVERNTELSTNGWLGTFFDAAGTICSSPVPVSPVYVVADVSGLPGSGVAGAEFRLESWRGRRPVFSFAAEAMPGWISIGDPFGDGVDLAASCAVSQGLTRVPMLKVWAFPLTENVDTYTTLFIKPHLNPSNPTYRDAVIVLCDAPTFTAIAAGRGYNALISTAETVEHCPSGLVAVGERTWSEVKELYR